MITMPQKSNTPKETIEDKSTGQQNNKNNLFCYEINGIHLFIESGIKMEVLEQSIIYPVPNAPKWYLGVTSLRSDILTVVNMHFLLDRPQNTKTRRLLRLEHPDFPPLVIAIDNLPHQRDVTPLASSSTSTTNKTDYPEWITASSKQNTHLFLFADHALLFRALQATSTTD
jgi:chemotaxis signal transduction protein